MGNFYFPEKKVVIWAAVVAAAAGILFAGAETVAEASCSVETEAASESSVETGAASGCSVETEAASGSSDGTGAADTIYSIPEIVVRAKAPILGSELYSRSGFVALIEMDKSGAALEDAPTVLAGAAGIRVRQYGGLGDFATSSIRGSSSSQVRVYMDGVPLNDPYSGIVNLADLSLGNLDRIEIYRGFSPVSFGGSSIGGTINLVTENAASAASSSGLEPMVSAKASAGSFDTRRLSLNLSSTLGPASLSCFGGYLESAGDFSFADDNATPQNPLDDEIARRMNNDFSRWNLSARLDLEIPGMKRSYLSYDAFEREGGVPGIGSNQSSIARLRRKRRITYFKIDPGQVVSGRLTGELTAFHSWTAEMFDDREGDIGLTAARTDNRIVSWGANLRSTLFAPLVPVSLDLFLEGKRERFSPSEYYPEPREGPDRTRNSLTSAVAANLSVLDDRAVLTAGARGIWSESEFYDQQPFPWLPPISRGRVEDSRLSPHAGIRIQPAGHITLKANIGKHYRVPTFFELFGNTGSVTGDAGLKPEEGLNRDAGLIYSSDRIWFLRRPYLETLYFDNRTEDLILFFPNSQRTVKPSNIGSARIKGIEVSASASPARSLTLSGNYTWMDAEDTSDIPYYRGNRLASIPAHEASFSARYSAGGWGLEWNLLFIGSNYLDKANMEKVPGREIHNLTVFLTPFSGPVRLSFEGRNLTGDQISDISGFPLPGRSFYVTLKLSNRGEDDDRIK